MDAPLLQTVGFLGLGLLTGAYGTLIGAGGGFALMPVLLLLYPLESPALLTSISLAVVFFNAASGAEAYCLMRRIDYKAGAIFAVAAVPGAVIGALSTNVVPRQLFDVIFGLVLLAGAAFLALHPAKRQREAKASSRLWMKRRITDRSGQVYEYSFNPVTGGALSVLVGYLSSFLGIGGGIIHVPLLVYLLGFPVHVATATSHFILAIMALSGTAAHIATGVFAHGAHRTIYLALGAIVGAQFGAKLSARVEGGWIIRSLAAALGFVGLRILWAAIR